MTNYFPDSTSGSEKIAPRYAFEARIQIRLERDQRKLSLQGWVRDLSESGLRAFIAEPLLLGESVVLEVPLADADKQVIPANVVRVLGTEYGFQFTALSVEQRCQIQATVKGRQAIRLSHSATQTSA